MRMKDNFHAHGEQMRTNDDFHAHGDQMRMKDNFTVGISIWSCGQNKRECGGPYNFQIIHSAIL